MTTDPVCGSEVSESDAAVHEYEGQIYYFCSDDCQEEFQENPEQYV